MAEVSTKIWEISRAGLETEICPEIFRSHSSQSLRKTRDFDDCMARRNHFFAILTAQDKRVAKGSARKAPASQTRYH